MAAAERDGIRAAGLDAPLEEYAATTERLPGAVGPLAEHLHALQAEVGDGVLTRIGKAERRMAEAVERAKRAVRAAQVAKHDAG